MKLIVGLGNPDKKYDRTRHNIGFLVLDKLAKELNLTWSLKKDWQALVAEGSDILLVKPQTYMNNSGLAVAKIANFYKLGTGENIGENLLVVHDELDLPFGKYKYSTNSSAAGHNGVSSIIEKIGGKNFKRCRIGIKSEALNKIRLGIFKTSPANFVLAKFSSSEWQEINNLADNIIKELDID